MSRRGNSRGMGGYTAPRGETPLPRGHYPTPVAAGYGGTPFSSYDPRRAAPYPNPTTSYYPTTTGYGGFPPQYQHGIVPEPKELTEIRSHLAKFPKEDGIESCIEVFCKIEYPETVRTAAHLIITTINRLSKDHPHLENNVIGIILQKNYIKLSNFIKAYISLTENVLDNLKRLFEIIVKLDDSKGKEKSKQTLNSFKELFEESDYLHLLEEIHKSHGDRHIAAIAPDRDEESGEVLSTPRNVAAKQPRGESDPVEEIIKILKLKKSEDYKLQQSSIKRLADIIRENRISEKSLINAFDDNTIPLNLSEMVSIATELDDEGLASFLWKTTHDITPGDNYTAPYDLFCKIRDEKIARDVATKIFQAQGYTSIQGFAIYVLENAPSNFDYLAYSYLIRFDDVGPAFRVAVTDLLTIIRPFIDKNEKLREFSEKHARYFLGEEDYLKVKEGLMAANKEVDGGSGEPEIRTLAPPTVELPDREIMAEEKTPIEIALSQDDVTTCLKLLLDPKINLESGKAEKTDIVFGVVKKVIAIELDETRQRLLSAFFKKAALNLTEIILVTQYLVEDDEIVNKNFLLDYPFDPFGVGDDRDNLCFHKFFQIEDELTAGNLAKKIITAYDDEITTPIRYMVGVNVDKAIALANYYCLDKNLSEIRETIKYVFNTIYILSPEKAKDFLKPYKDKFNSEWHHFLIYELALRPKTDADLFLDYDPYPVLLKIATEEANGQLFKELGPHDHANIIKLLNAKNLKANFILKSFEPRDLNDIILVLLYLHAHGERTDKAQNFIINKFKDIIASSGDLPQIIISLAEERRSEALFLIETFYKYIPWDLAKDLIGIFGGLDNSDVIRLILPRLSPASLAKLTVDEFLEARDADKINSKALEINASPECLQLIGELEISTERKVGELESNDLSVLIVLALIRDNTEYPAVIKLFNKWLKINCTDVTKAIIDFVDADLSYCIDKYDNSRIIELLKENKSRIGFLVKSSFAPANFEEFFEILEIIDAGDHYEAFTKKFGHLFKNQESETIKILENAYFPLDKKRPIFALFDQKKWKEFLFRNFVTNPKRAIELASDHGFVMPDIIDFGEKFCYNSGFIGAVRDLAKRNRTNLAEEIFNIRDLYLFAQFIPYDNGEIQDLIRRDRSSIEFILQSPFKPNDLDCFFIILDEINDEILAQRFVDRFFHEFNLAKNRPQIIRIIDALAEKHSVNALILANASTDSLDPEFISNLIQKFGETDSSKLLELFPKAVIYIYRDRFLKAKDSKEMLALAKEIVAHPNHLEMSEPREGEVFTDNHIIALKTARFIRDQDILRDKINTYCRRTRASTDVFNLPGKIIDYANQILSEPEDADKKGVMNRKLKILMNLHVEFFYVLGGNLKEDDTSFREIKYSAADTFMKNILAVCDHSLITQDDWYKIISYYREPELVLIMANCYKKAGGVFTYEQEQQLQEKRSSILHDKYAVVLDKNYYVATYDQAIGAPQTLYEAHKKEIPEIFNMLHEILVRERCGEDPEELRQRKGIIVNYVKMTHCVIHTSDLDEDSKKTTLEVNITDMKYDLSLLEPAPTSRVAANSCDSVDMSKGLGGVMPK